MIRIRTIEELEAEHNRQLDAWIEDGKEEIDFFLDLAESDLRGTNLRGACLSSAKLLGADLNGAYLNLAYLSGANLDWANLSGANLEWANLTQANLRFADLRGAHFRSFQLGASNLYDTIITPSQYDELARLFNSNFMHFFIVKGLYEDL